MPVTILEVAESRGLKRDADGNATAGAFHEVGLDLIGGCARCGACIAAYNACPSRSGYWCCVGCVGKGGFDTIQQFENWCEEGGREDDEYL
jgi:hypothetical protein